MSWCLAWLMGLEGCAASSNPGRSRRRLTVVAFEPVSKLFFF